MGDAVTVLVVDDEEGILRLLETVLSAAGHRVLLADSGERALELVEGAEVDVALVDKNLPDMDGVVLVRRLGESRPDLVAAIMTGYGSLRSSLDAMDAGVARYLLKPFEDIAIVSRTVWDILQERDVRVRRRASLCELAAETTADPSAPIRIILADASAEDREVLAVALREVGCEPTLATCAQEALLKLGEKRHDVLVVDYDMGDMTADDVLLRAKRVNPEVAVIVTAESPSLAMTTALIRRGAAGFVEKPLKDRERTAESIVRHGQAARLRMEALEKPAPKRSGA